MEERFLRQQQSEKHHLISPGPSKGSEPQAKISLALARLDTMKEKFPGDKERLKRIISMLFELLPKDEQENLISSPENFTSKRFLFRGLDRSKLRDFIQTQKMQPQEGQYGSTAVFTTDSPFAAATFMDDQGALVVFDKAEINYKSKDGKPYDVSDPNLKEMFTSYLDSLPPAERSDAMYLGYNQWDVSSTLTPGKPGKNVELRNAQPLSAVVSIIIPNSIGKKAESFDPNVELNKNKIKYILEEPFSKAA